MQRGHKKEHIVRFKTIWNTSLHENRVKVTKKKIPTATASNVLAHWQLFIQCEHKMKSNRTKRRRRKKSDIILPLYAHCICIRFESLSNWCECEFNVNIMIQFYVRHNNRWLIYLCMHFQFCKLYSRFIYALTYFSVWCQCESAQFSFEKKEKKE